MVQYRVQGKVMQWMMKLNICSHSHSMNVSWLPWYTEYTSVLGLFNANSLDRSAGYIQRVANALQLTPQANIASSNWGIRTILTTIHSGDCIEVCSLFFVLAIQQVSVTIYQYAPCSLLSNLRLLLKTSSTQMPSHKSSACSYTLSICWQLTPLGFGSTLWQSITASRYWVNARYLLALSHQVTGLDILHILWQFLSGISSLGQC